MSDPVRIQLSRRKGWRMPPNTVKVDRSTKWGNPFAISERMTREEAVEQHRRLLVDGKCRLPADMTNEDAVLYAIGVHMEIGQLRGKNLACWCKPGQKCHADVLLELANRSGSWVAASPNTGADHD